MMGREGMFELDGFLGFGAHAEGDRSGHGPYLSKKEMNQ
jgi:hypothetical protein